MTVYAVQQQMKFDAVTRELVPRFPSINKAERYGPIRFILSPSAHPFAPDLILGDIHRALAGFSDNDHLLLIGNPGIIGMCCAVASHYNDGKIKFLQWSGRHSDYTEITAEIY